MTRPDDIPADVRDLAREAVYAPPPPGGTFSIQGAPHVITNVARAILAERERCAGVAGELVFDEHALAQATDLGRATHLAAFCIREAILAGAP